MQLTADEKDMKVPLSFSDRIFRVSYMMLGASGCITVFVVGWIMALTRVYVLKVKFTRPKDNLLHPCLRLNQPVYEPSSQDEQKNMLSPESGTDAEQVTQQVQQS